MGFFYFEIYCFCGILPRSHDQVPFGLLFEQLERREANQSSSVEHAAVVRCVLSRGDVVCDDHHGVGSFELFQNHPELFG